MKFGLAFVNTAAAVHPEGAVAMVRAAEAAGFESLWTVEHIVIPSGYASEYPYARGGKLAGGVEDFDLPDPLIWLSYVAAVTDTIRLATGITVLPLRNPLILAKQAATIDVLSGGRFILGIGSGWLAEEFAALGVPFDDRGDRTDDSIRALRALWTEDLASYDGSHVSFRDVYSRPQPVQRPIPIVVGGHSRRAARRAGELGDGFFPGTRPREVIADLVSHARRSAEGAGRDPEALEITVGCRPDRESAEEWTEAGVDRVVVFLPGNEAIEAFGEVIAAFR
jgi:probable F420-dependent oxidoreductase